MKYLFLFLVMATHVFGQAIEITGVAATVNGRVITKKEVRSLLAPTISILKTKYPRGGEAANMEFKKAQNDVLEQLIENKIILTELEERGASIPEYVIDQEIKRIVNDVFNGSEAAFRQSLNDSSTTMRSFRNAHKEKILVQALKSEQFGGEEAPPSPQEIKEQYALRQVEYRDRTQDKITFSKIFIPIKDGPDSTPEMQLALAEQVAFNLKRGADFALTAKKYSADAYAEDGGQWPETSRTDFDPSFAELLFQSKVGEISGPFKDPRGFTVVRIDDVNYGPSPALSEVKDRIIKEIESEKYKERYTRWIKTLKRKAIIDRRI